MRKLMFLATRSSRAYVGDIARLFGISVNHFAKVVNLLAREGYIRSTCGVGGGIELARQPEDISIGAIVATMEMDMHLAFLR